MEKLQHLDIKNDMRYKFCRQPCLRSDFPSPTGESAKPRRRVLPRAARIRRRCFSREWVGEKPGQGRSRRSCRSRDTQGSLTQKPQGMLVESLIPPPKLLFQAAPWALIQKATSESYIPFALFLYTILQCGPMGGTRQSVPAEPWRQ
ncbi:Atpase Family Aaa Domain-Containing Protein 2 [Manis pentadactyla]|nr:Atpase Family Aaa Domain-Containing Protein 2 [Manis pentadactyla]